MKMYTDPKAEAYEQVIDLTIRSSECFVLGDKMPVSTVRDEYMDVLKSLEPYLIKTIIIQMDDNMDEITHLMNTYRSHAFYTAGTYYFFRCCEESGTVLKQTANRLSDWVFPHLPEDLCFLKAGGGDYLYSVVHENMYGLDVTEEEAAELMNQIPGLFLQLEAHKDFDRLLDDAIKHKTDRLYISGYHLKELPDRIRELTELRELEVFEQDLYRLPESLFALHKLESLRLMSADLESIPASIARLKSLREFTIQCGSSDRPARGFKVKRKEEISLNRIPPEIGELQHLERLTIEYTSISELPVELARLTRLRFLNIQPCMIKQPPAFLQEMKQLEYVQVSASSWLT